MGIGTLDMASKNIADDMGNGMRSYCRHITFAITNNAIICDQFHKDEITATKSGWRITYHKV